MSAPGKDRPILFSGPMVRALLDGRKTMTRRVLEPETLGADEAIRIPYSLRDRLWVRETWAERLLGEAASYRADVQDAPIAWRPSIFMPRWASRLTLIVTDVRVERVQEISEEDARAEGCFKGHASGRVFNDRTSMRLGGDEWSSARDWFADLWDSLNASRGHGWDANPWVAALTFDVHHRNIDALREAAE